MHTTAYNNAKKFFDNYIKDAKGKRILDVGSYDVNGSLKPIFKEGEYIGLDQAPGPNVDVVSSSHKIEMEDNSFDIIVTSSCFEHDPMFWLTFLEMVRLVKPGGYIYNCVPSQGHYHGFPGDCWRFYKDSAKGLTEWAHHEGYTNLKLSESYIDDEDINWKDHVMIWKKDL